MQSFQNLRIYERVYKYMIFELYKIDPVEWWECMVYLHIPGITLHTSRFPHEYHKCVTSSCVAKRVLYKMYTYVNDMFLTFC